MATLSLSQNHPLRAQLLSIKSKLKPVPHAAPPVLVKKHSVSKDKLATFVPVIVPGNVTIAYQLQAMGITSPLKIAKQIGPSVSMEAKKQDIIRGSIRECSWRAYTYPPDFLRRVFKQLDIKSKIKGEAKMSVRDEKATSTENGGVLTSLERSNQL